MQISASQLNIRAIEWPTLLLAAAIYAVWWLLLGKLESDPIWAIPSMIVLLTWHSSLVHEVIHGHPTPWRWCNHTLAMPPLTLIYPFHLFRRLHLTHHHDEQITIPDVDPESFYQCPIKWQRMGSLSRTLYWINMTLAGRLLLGPLFSIRQVIQNCIADLRPTTRPARRLIWPTHLLLCTLVLIVVHDQVAILTYLICAYASLSLLGLRSFFEHRAALLPAQRIVIVKSCQFFNLLFLCNNYHATHHRYPTLPWYFIVDRYRQELDQTLNDNGHYYFEGYSSWLRFLVSPVTSPVYPLALPLQKADE